MSQDKERAELISEFLKKFKEANYGNAILLTTSQKTETYRKAPKFEPDCVFLIDSLKAMNWVEEDIKVE